ncbi:hypothetical protein J6U78_03555 [bacterium]|nr:hypothetical protein [bacterium]
MKAILFRFGVFVWIVACWLFIGYLLNALCFGAVRRNPPRYKVAPTNVVLKIDGTNCWVRYMWDNLLLTNLVVMVEPFDPPPAVVEASTNNVMEVENE